MNKTQCLTLHILYGGLRYENEHFSSKYKSSWTDRFVFESPPQSICTPVTCKAKEKKAKYKIAEKLLPLTQILTVMDLQTRKLNLIEYLIGLQDEKIFQRIEDSINKTLQTTNQPLRQFTQQELTDRALKSNEDYQLGKFQDQEKLEKESSNW